MHCLNNKFVKDDQSENILLSLLEEKKKKAFIDEVWENINLHKFSWSPTDYTGCHRNNIILVMMNSWSVTSLQVSGLFL